MIMSPKSTHASTIARHRMVKPSNKDLQVESSGSASAMMPQSAVHSGSKVLRRRPQTTKRDYGAGMTGLSGVTSSALDSENVDINYNEAALLRTQQQMMKMDGKQRQLLSNEISADPEIAAEMSSLPRVVTTTDGN